MRKSSKSVKAKRDKWVDLDGENMEGETMGIRVPPAYKRKPVVVRPGMMVMPPFSDEAVVVAVFPDLVVFRFENGKFDAARPAELFGAGLTTGPAKKIR
ncbi:MAG TPA: hypothetical protein VH370_01355 [Humisphaera sp.]|jgi:hypothetical protein|nr:hypothetical protein [Humisphaera sp.]